MLQKTGLYYAGLEAGGTKFVCMVAAGPDDILAQTSFPTTYPEETLGKAIAFFQAHQPRSNRDERQGHPGRLSSGL
jgi:predicted NBD/HSP70 family sugar kinase